MKVFLTVTIILFSFAVEAYILSDGVYNGLNAKTGGKCKITITDEGDYLYFRKAEYRLTVLTKGAYVDCKDEEGVEYDFCASGEQTNGKEDKSLYMLLTDNGDIQKIYFHDYDHDSTNDRTCVGFKKL